MREKQINQGLSFGPEQLCEGCAIYKDSSGSLVKEQMCRDGKRGRKDVLKIQRFFLSTLISCFPFAVQLEMLGRLLDADICCCTVVVKSTVSGPEHVGSNDKSRLHCEPHCLGLLI